ncbi:Lipopolysaccharide export system permease protein LptF [Halioglobus japonicus]|nr:Lipopolysaccharide export system permease protein LptF [Halioglobus japonicus]
MPFFSVAAVLLIIFMGYSLSRFLHKADAGLLNTDEVALLTLLKTLIALEVLLPIGLFFGLMLALGKLHNDSEIVAMQASGIGESRMVRAVAALAIPLALVIAGLSLYVRPWAFSLTYEMLAVAKASSDIDRVKPGQFYLTNTPALQEEQSEDKQRAIFIETISPDKALDHVFIRIRTGDELKVISSRTGLLVEHPGSDYQTLELDNARIYKKVDDGPDLFAQIEHFTMKVSDTQPEPPEYKSKSVATAKLASSENPADQSEYQWRLSNPVTTLLLALLAIPLSRSRPRQGRYAKLLLAFVIYAAYYNMIGIARTWVEQQTATTIWWAPSLLALVLVFFYLPWHSLGVKRLTRKHTQT